MINYESPIYVDIVLYTIYFLLVVAVALTAWSVVHSLRKQGKDAGVEHGIPARRIAVMTAALLLVTMAATWLLGSSSPLNTNGKVYDDTFWLRTSDMLLLTPLALLIVLVVLGAISVFRSYQLSKE